MTSSPAVVVIEIAPSDAASPYASSLVAACSEGLRSGGQCALGTAKDEPAPAVAVVAWDAEAHLSVRVEVGVRSGARAEWLTRQVAFHPSDAEDERWRAVGLVIATLVGEVAAATEPAAAQPAAPQAPEPPPPPPPLASAAPAFSRPAAFCFDLGFALSRGTSDTFAARGGSLRASRRLGASAWFATASLRYEAQPGAAPQVDLAWGWATVGVGVTAIVPGTRLLVDARLEPTVGWIRASLADGSGGPQGHALFGAREGLAVTWWLTDAIGASLGAELSETTRRAIIRLAPAGGEPTAAAAERTVGWTTSLAARIRLD